MSQRRYFNFGTPVSAGALNEAHSNLTTKGVLKGGGTYIIQPNILVIEPISLMFPTGILFSETEAVQLVIPFSSTNLAFTITYRHNDGGLIGGTGATLQAEPGFISNEDPLLSDGVAIAYIKYIGTGLLLQTQIYEAPQLTLDASVTVGDGDYRLPPFGEGFLLIPSSPVITPITTSTNSKASYLYTNGPGGILFTSVLDGAGGNDLAFNFTDGPTSTPVVVTAATTTKLTIYPAKTANVITSTMASLAAALNLNGTFNSKMIATATGTTSTLVGVFPFGNTGTLYQNLSGGVTNNGISYVITNTHTSDVTHVLKWVFVARKQSPRSVVLEFSLGGTSTITLSAVDTDGTIVDLDSPTDLIQSSGLTRRTVRITDGNFISGQRYFVQATILTKTGESSTLTFIGASHYNLPF